MQRSNVRTSVHPVLVAVVAAGIFLQGAGGAIAQGRVQKISKSLIDRAENTVSTLDEAEKQLGKVTDRYEKLMAAANVNDRRKAHGKVRDELQNFEKRSKQVRERSRDMENEASKFFKEWEKSLDGIKDGELRLLSRQSFSGSRENYSQVIAAARNAADQYDAFVVALGNQLKYLELDLSDQSIAKLKSSKQDLGATAKELGTRVAGTEAEIRRYISTLR